MNSPIISRMCYLVMCGIVAILGAENNLVFADLTISHTPLADTYDLQNDREVRAISTAESILLFYRVDGSSFSVVSGISSEKPGIIPPFPPGSLIEYYIEASDTEGNVVTSPSNAPLNLHSYRVVDPSVGSKALSLDGNGDYVQIPHQDLLDVSKSFSLELYIKRQGDLGRNQFLISKNQTGGSDKPGYILQLTPGNMMHMFWEETNSSREQRLIGDSPIDDAEWHHWAYVRDADMDTSLLYIDGELYKSMFYPNEIGDVDNAPLFIGAEGGTAQFFKGLIDEVRIWDRSLTQSEIRANMRRGLVGDQEELAGYWAFDEIDAEGLVPDLSGNGNHGTLKGDAHLVPSDSGILTFNRGFLHTPSDSVSFSEDSLSLSAEVLSYRRQASSALLLYRVAENENFKQAEMVFDNGMVTGQIPPLPLKTAVEYYFHSSDDLGDILTPVGAPDSLFSYLIHGPDIETSPSLLSFGVVEIAQTHIETLTVTNAGNSPLTVSSIRSSNPRFRPLIPAFDVAPGESLSVPVGFTPISDEAQEGELTLVTNDVPADTVTVSLKGMSTDADTPPEPVPDTRGDIDGDGEITSGDAILVLRMAAGLLTPADAQLVTADVDDDGSITAGDAILILRMAAGLIDPPTKRMVGQPISLLPVDMQLREADSSSDGSYALVLTLDRMDGIAGGDLELRYDSHLKLSEDIRLKGLSPGASSIVNQEDGRIRLSFIDPNGYNENSPLTLHIPFTGGKPDTPITLRLQGRLYDRRGTLAGSVHFQQEAPLTLPTIFVLHPNYPNPFNASTSLRYELPRAGHVVLHIYSLTGQLVKTLVDRSATTGYHEVEWNGKDEQGKEVGSGIYISRLSLDNGIKATRRMVLLK